MAFAVARIRIIVVAAVLSATWLPGVSHADVGDPLDAVVGTTGGVEVPDPLADAGDSTVGKVTDASEDAEDTLRKTTQPVQRTVRDLVRRATESVQPAPEETSSDVETDTAETIQASDRPHRDPGPAIGSRQLADHARGQADRNRAAVMTTTAQKRSGSGRSNSPAGRGQRGAGPVTLARELPAGHPCASGSLAARDLRLCARAGTGTGAGASTSLPELGGIPGTLLPAGLVLLGLGLILVACGSRRGTSVAPGT
jgi:hypothetical protein